MKWNVLVQINEHLLHDKEYTCFKEIATDLNLSYQQVADISTNRNNKFMNNKFKYAPVIIIEKLSCDIINNGEEGEEEKPQEEEG